MITNLPAWIPPACILPGVVRMNRILAMSILLLCAVMARAEDWPAWRGPRLDGISSEKNLPIKWSVTKDVKTGVETMENIAWRTPIEGRGHSSPIVHGDFIFLTTCTQKEENRILLKEQKRMLLCLD